MTTGLRRDQQRGFEIRPGEIGTDELADSSVTTAKILDGTVAYVDLAAALSGTGTTTIDPDDATSHGVTNAFSRTDHQHQATAGTPDALTKTATSAENNGTTWARNNHTHATSALPWGIVARQTLTGSNGPHSASATTDFALSSVVVDVLRLYVVHMQCQASLDTAGDWTFDFHVGGTLTLQLGRVDLTAANSQDCHYAKLWTPSSGTVNLDVRLIENSGASSITLNGTSTVTRDFWVEDIGLR